MFDPDRFRMPLGECDFTVVVLRSIMKANRCNDVVRRAGMIERHHGIHSPAQKHNSLQNGISSTFECSASTVTLTPPRGENSP